ncbi:HipA domain-containing protein [Herbiconiux sp. CPCC 205716]|uniref:HipA domain-containing protein n=1 Tax=Herbiconiux gentiana TaxID=2970912 RepID=A0ABT2GIF4_9MICO|nr:HipA domain-containing protein [Herbiconiux gentiana]MCS5716009.1 HipA domain-containing protein [Herbiconiux gentiana]
MTDPGELTDLRFVEAADVYKAGSLAASLERVPGAGIRFSYRPDFVASADATPIASTLPLDAVEVTGGGGLPAFFAGLLPEGRRLTVLRSAVKTSLDDELTLLLAVGADVPGDVQVVPRGTAPVDAPSVVTGGLAEQEFSAVVDEIDRHGLPGVQDKLSAEMISSPLALEDGRFILKLDPPAYPHLVRNEAVHLSAARSLRLPVSSATVVHDRLGADGLLVRRFDRVRVGDGWRRLPVEDATQALALPPADKYRIDAADAVAALSRLCAAPVVAVRNLYLQFVFAWLTGNGDLHGKNVAVLGGPDGRTAIAPIYDVPCTLLYGDDSLALPIAGRTTRLRRRHWAEFADAIGLPQRAARSAEAIALRAAGSVELSALPFEGSPLKGAERELRFRRAELRD